MDHNQARGGRWVNPSSHRPPQRPRPELALLACPTAPLHAAGRSYDVVIGDLLMPDMMGDRLFRICQREHPEIADRFVFTSGCSGLLPAVDFAAASGQPYLRKPCRLAKIRAAIDRTT